MDQKWITLRSNTILKDRWINLRADSCATSSGRIISPYYVLSYPDWVHVVALTPQDRLVLVHQYRHAANETLLELPGGAVDPSDASLEQAARRELEEETGFRAHNWELISSLYPNPATQTNRIHTYLATDAVSKRPQQLDEGEEGLRIAVVAVSDVLAGLRVGLLGQSMQVGAVLMGLAVAGRLKLEF
jgi:8-oxo-dGTP pyrophosphatase MutT (NUDIX family)